MVNKVKIFSFIVFIAALLSGCGDSQRDKDKHNVVDVTSLQRSGQNLNEKNFLNIAKYHYIRELAYGNLKREPLSGDSKVMRELRSRQKKNQRGVFYVKTIKSPENFIHYMRIKCDGAVVHIRSDKQENSVSVRYIKNGKEIIKKLDLPSFTDTGVNIKDAENGEKI